MRRKMRILLVSDLHGDINAAQDLVAMSRKADVVIGAGDFAKKRRGLHEIINVLAAIQCPSVVVPGNSESFKELKEACRTWPTVHVLHGSGVEIHGLKFWGVGGAIPITRFGTWDFSEEEGRQLLAHCPRGAVLVSHSPPQGIVDKLSTGENCGSVAVLETIKRCRPKLVV